MQHLMKRNTWNSLNKCLLSVTTLLSSTYSYFCICRDSTYSTLSSCKDSMDTVSDKKHHESSSSWIAMNLEFEKFTLHLRRFHRQRLIVMNKCYATTIFMNIIFQQFFNRSWLTSIINDYVVNCRRFDPKSI